MQPSKGGANMQNKVATPHGSDKNATPGVIQYQVFPFNELQLPTGQIKMQRNWKKNRKVKDSCNSPRVR